MKKIAKTWRRSAAAFMALIAIFACQEARADKWSPPREVEYIVPAGPGAALDTAARKLMSELTSAKLLDKPVVITNRPGASGEIAIQQLEGHKGDGQWLTTFTTGMLSMRAMHAGSGSYYTNLTPIAVLFQEAVVVAVRADSPLHSAADLVAKLKKDPTSLSIGIATTLGNHIHLGLALPLKTAGVDISRLVVAPFKSSMESMTALLGGHLDVVAATTPNVIALARAGEIRILAVATDKRLSGALSNVPTWKEQGVDASFTSVQGVMGPPGMTPEQVRFWEQALSRVANSAQWKSFLASQNWRPSFMTQAQMQSYLAKQYPITEALIKELKLPMQAR